MFELVYVISRKWRGDGREDWNEAQMEEKTYLERSGGVVGKT